MANEALALIVDDEPDICELLSMTLLRMGVRSQTAHTLQRARDLLREQSFDFCLTDMRLPDGDGLSLVHLIQERYRPMPVAVITAHGNMDTATKAMKFGAFDFVSKPVDLQQLRSLVQTALKLAHLPSDEDSGQRLLQGDSSAMGQLRQRISKVARSNAPIYISGESGSGKELTARSIHAASPRASGPFIAVNCGAIPSELMESEFFGHRRGSFTGAHQDKAGLFQMASGGTLFLDEVADLPLDMQVKLLRAIQEKSVRPVGAGQETAVDVRILSATHKDLAAEVSHGHFRSDLYYRINVIELPVPALRERRGDIPQLCNSIVSRLARDAGVPTPALTPLALAALDEFPFPGNVRQLENILERAFTLSGGSEIDAEDLNLVHDIDRHSASPAQKTAPAVLAAPTAALQSALSAYYDPAAQSLDEYLEDIERDVLEKTLVQTRWNRTAAAEKLGISFRSLRYRLKKLGLDD
ncbi:sigma-54-dependent transcriptional regulator [Biformimicrobium ophioploci]|uniref:Sigma-54 dependent transcriptional regulator n=1 Tax=Biformimicrobium ophioploci TaxID=3036711 RepID=A0ABQ6M2J0_9GAMM|nr:sigma-54 dependent transcriptional regulator [Microbulbifer sp. NKW57]GMG88574.1 sigma-54 dependent transcriptional regulator [Microbulbifer sp. NKW57]